MQPVLEYRGITKAYTNLVGRKPFTALRDFSLSVEQGEIFGFLGPNGAGKTTAINLALGLMYPTSGTGMLLGKPFGEARTRRKVGFLAENVFFYNRKATQMLRFYGGLSGASGPILNKKIRDLLELLGLQEVSDKPIGKFSRGMLQRMGLAQALANDPKLLILDEPTSALDPSSRVMVREILLRAKEEGKTVFLSSHLLSEIEMICDRVGIISRGRLARVGRVAELLESADEFEITARTAGSGENGPSSFMVPAAEQRKTIEKIWAEGGEVLSVRRKRRSLEDVFLSLTSEGDGE